MSAAQYFAFLVVAARASTDLASLRAILLEARLSREITSEIE
jgi:hypothetical protein